MVRLKGRCSSNAIKEPTNYIDVNLNRMCNCNETTVISSPVSESTEVRVLILSQAICVDGE